MNADSFLDSKVEGNSTAGCVEVSPLDDAFEWQLNFSLRHRHYIESVGMFNANSEFASKLFLFSIPTIFCVGGRKIMICVAFFFQILPNPPHFLLRFMFNIAFY